MVMSHDVYGEELNDNVSSYDNSYTETYNEIQSSSIKFSVTRTVGWYDGLPQRIWVSRDGYSGYLPLVRYEGIFNVSWTGTYTGRLYKHVAPNYNLMEE